MLVETRTLSTQAITPELITTNNNDMPVNQDGHVPLLWVIAYIAAATQNTTVITGARYV